MKQDLKIIVRVNFGVKIDEIDVITNLKNFLSNYGDVECIKEPVIYWKYKDEKQALFEVTLFDENSFQFICNSASKEWDELKSTEAVWNKVSKEKKEFFITPHITWAHFEVI